MAPAPSVHELIRVVQNDARSSEPLELLAAAATTVADLDKAKDEVLGYFVDSCRGSGKSWTDISAALGVSKQAAHRKFSVGDPSLERFTERARRVVDLGSTVARSLNHHYVGTEHVLLAIMVEGQGFAARVLQEQGINRETVEAAVLLVSPRGAAAPAGSIPWTPRAATVLTGAVTTAIELNHNYVGTEHLLLALMREPEALATKILAAHKIDPKDVRLRVIDLTKEVASA